MRIILDISTVAPRYGVPGGVGRVETEFAAYAVNARPDVQFSVFDPFSGTFCQVKRDRVPALIGTEAIIDMPRRPSRTAPATPWHRVGKAFRWLNRFEYNLQLALERRRLTSGSPSARNLAASGVALVSHSRAFRKRSKFTPTILPFEIATDGPLELDADCVLVSVGGHLGYRRPDEMAELKSARGFRYVVLCHDLILIQFPELVSAATSEMVRRHWVTTFAMSDLLVFTTHTVEKDVHAFCAEHDIALGQTSVVGLGWDPQPFAREVASALPPSLEPGKYVLQVSSLDARKGHDLMLRVWTRLLAEGIPQSHGFKLVFVGNYGTNTPHLKKTLASGAMGPTVVHFRNVSDGQLAAFYRNAGFCVFPSRYEGFGLPAVEALGMGKPLIASTGGAIPEVVGDLAPCLDPDDEDAWCSQIRTWIVDPDERKRAQERARRDFRYPTWHQSAEAFFAAIDRFLSSAPDRP